MKEQIEKAMRYRNICSPEEAVEAIEFVRDLIELQIKDTVENEPYATRWLDRAQIAVPIVSDLEGYLEEKGVIKT